MAPSSRGFARIVWLNDPITRNLATLPARLDAGLAAIMSHQSNAVQNYARANAGWTDQTGNARGGLMAVAYKSGGRAGGRNAAGQFTKASKGGHGIVLYHSVEYGLWLEVRWSGRYAIIMPTIEEKGPDVMRMVNKLLERV